MTNLKPLLYSIGVVFVIVNLFALRHWLSGRAMVTGLRSALDGQEDPFYPAVLLAYSRGGHVEPIVTCAAVHRSRRQAGATGSDEIAAEVLPAVGERDLIAFATDPDRAGITAAYRRHREWITTRLPGWDDHLDFRPYLIVVPAFFISGWIGLCACVYLWGLLKAENPHIGEGTGGDDTSPFDGILCAGLAAWIAAFVAMLAVQGLLWAWFAGRWDAQLRRHAVHVIRTELGDGYPAFESDVSRIERPARQ